MNTKHTACVASARKLWLEAQNTIDVRHKTIKAAVSAAFATAIAVLEADDVAPGVCQFCTHEVAEADTRAAA